MEEIIKINGSDLTIDQIYRVAYDNQVKVGIDENVIEDVEQSRKVVDDLVAKDMVVYGLTTGFGNFKNITISKDQTEELQLNLIRSHAVGTGPVFFKAEVRAAILIRANSLLKGYSGVRLLVIEKLLELLNKDIYPFVPQQGSVGSSGDLAPLSHLTLVLMGEGEVIEGGERVESVKILNKYSYKPIRLSYKEGLALNNGTSFMTAVASLNIKKVENLINWADRSLAMSLEALRGTLSAYEERVHLLRPYHGQLLTAAHVRKLCQGSQLVGPNNNYNSVQDSYSLRCSPQVHGAVRDNFDYVRRVVEIEINSATDNPIVFTDTAEAVSAGHFHGEPIAIAMDCLSIAVSELANISERRTAKLMDPSTNNGLPAFLIALGKGGLDNGFMIAQYTAAALVSENKVLAHPASVDSIPTSANQEDHVSFGTIAARQCRDIISNAERVVAIELMCAAQGLDFRKPLLPGLAVRKIYDLIRRHVPFLNNDRVLYRDLEILVKIIRKSIK